MSVIEKITVSANELVDKVKQLIYEGNIRRIRLIHKDNTLFEIPLSVGLPAIALGIIVAPILAAVAAIVTECTMEVEKAE
ncbi:DUF4342 domain-containing protein [Chloroflexota bacterium]